VTTLVLKIALAPALVVGVTLFARAFLRKNDQAHALSSSRPSWDLHARVVSTAALVTVLTTVAGTLGPAMSGVLTSFPVAGSVLAAFTLANDGPTASLAMLRGFVVALPGFAVFFFAVAVALG
jgi:hypothetical protein